METANFEIITPEIAMSYLGYNTANYRPYNQKRQVVYAEDIRNGLWQVNGEAIVFDEDGTLKNGQHRLHAIIQANKPVKILVVRGISRDVSIFDSGYKRSIGQLAKASGTPSPKDVLGAVNELISGFGKNAAPRGTINSYINAHYEELLAASKIVSKGANRPIAKKAACCLAVYCIRRYGLATDELLNEFFWIVNNQNILSDQKRNPSAPLFVARILMSKTIPNDRGLHQKEQFCAVVQGVNDYKKNNPRKRTYKYNEDTMSIFDHIREEDNLTTITRRTK